VTEFCTARVRSIAIGTTLRKVSVSVSVSVEWRILEWGMHGTSKERSLCGIDYRIPCLWPLQHLQPGEPGVFPEGAKE